MTATFWTDRPVLVTGATGLLGGHVVRRLVDLGADVVCLVRDHVPQSMLYREDLDRSVRLVRGDVCDQQLLERALGEYEVTTVLHLAAQTIVGVANRNPIGTFETNIRGTWSVLEACRRTPSVTAVIAASSDKAYGSHDVLPYAEDAPLKGRHPYDVSKSCSDLIAQSYAHAFGLPIVITRCGNFYGPGDLNWNRLIPGTIRAIVRGQRPLIRSDGTFIRDYFYVLDGARVYTMLAERLTNDRTLAGHAFNFSNELQLTALAVVKRILALTDSSLTPDVRNDTSNEIRNQHLSATKARAILDWAPHYDFDEALQATINWYRTFLSATSAPTATPPCALALKE